MYSNKFTCVINNTIFFFKYLKFILKKKYQYYKDYYIILHYIYIIKIIVNNYNYN